MGSDEAPSFSAPDERRGIDRRTLIRRAAVAGAAVWTVPVIIDSLASPAAAASCPVGCFTLQVSNTCTSLPAGACTPICTKTTRPCTDFGISATTTGGPTNFVHTFTVGGVCGCKFVSGENFLYDAADLSAEDCAPPTSFSTTTLVWDDTGDPSGGDPGADTFYLTVQCAK